MSRADQDRYFAESGEIARLLDADPVPRTRAEAERLIADFRHELRADERTRAFRDLVLKAPRIVNRGSAGSAVADECGGRSHAAISRRAMHGLRRPLLAPVVRGATYGLAGTISWAFAGERYRAAH